MGSAAFCGICVQIYNATFLANVLVKGVLRAEPRRVQQRFDEWMELYKITVGALHVWSWRITWYVGGALAFLSFTMMARIFSLVFLYTTFFDVNAGIPEEKRLGFFLESISSGRLEFLAVQSLVLALTLAVLALVSSRYKRLRVLLATVRLDQRLDAFEILHANHAAITLYDIPITFKVVLVVVNLIVVQVALLALAAATA